MYRFLVRILMLWLLSSLSLAYAACEKPIKFGSLTWESGQFTTALIRNIVEKGYGCATTEIPGTSLAIENALSQNDIQVIGETWVGRSPVLQKAIENKTVSIVGDTLKGGATQGWYVPDYVLNDNPELRSYTDLSKFAHLFDDPENPGHARFLNCPTGWVCEIFNTRLLKTTGLDNLFTNVHPGTGAALDAEIASAYEQKKPILFYYWQPTGLMAKYHFKEINFPAYNDSCWKDLLDPNGKQQCVSNFAVSKLSIAVSTSLIQQNPQLIEFFKKMQFTPDQLNKAILQMQEGKRSGQDQSLVFLREHPEIWRNWVSEEAAEKIQQSLGVASLGQSYFPKWSVQNSINKHLTSIVQNYGDTFRNVSRLLIQYVISPIERVLAFVPAWLLILLVGALAWHSTRRKVFTILSMAGLFLIGAFGLWAGLIQTLSLLLVSVLLTIIIGVPLGIWISYRDNVYRFFLPVLDIMQTMPSFVYLIPVLMLFGLGKVPALFATMIYALAPLIRLTALGIRQVPREMQETGTSFGSSPWQMLRWVILPAARPSIMAGINQAVMMSLSMVVLASMIGAPGLGEQVLQAIQTLNVGQGIQSGGAIVILAIIIDRITQGYGRVRQQIQIKA